MVKAFAPAKINLTLHVTGQKEDGYHLLDSLVVFADVGDDIEAEAARGLALEVSGPMAVGVPTDRTNLMIRAAEKMGARDVLLRLEKRLPAASGIGGGSSDAAAVMRALHEMKDLPLPEDGGVSLGADVPVCLGARTARMRGIGERVDPVEGVAPMPAVLVNPGVGVSTPAVFKALECRANAAMDQIPQGLGIKPFCAWLATQRNDLEAPARIVQPVIGDVLDVLRKEALLARMSGSGATCFGLYEEASAAARVAGEIRTAYPDWWVQPCLLGERIS